MNDKQIDAQSAIKALDAEVMVIHDLLEALICAHPNAPKILASFRDRIESNCRNVLPDTDPELIVEYRARAHQHLIVLASLTGANVPG